MTRKDTATLLATVRIAWPHSNLGGNPNEVLGFWHSMLKDAQAAEAEAALREIVATGERFAPPVGVIVEMVGLRSVDAPEFDQAWPEIQRLIRRRGRNQKPSEEHFSHRTVATFAIPSWEELCNGPAVGTEGYQTHYAQQRNAYNAMVARATRDASLGLVGAPRRRGELKLLDPLKSLGLEKP